MASPTSPGTIHSTADSTSSQPLPAWHFPYGPSVKFSQRERRKNAARHTRNNSSYTPHAPRLATEQRSHHRRALSGLPSPPSSASDYSQSPLSRFGRSTLSMAQQSVPTTPARARRSGSGFHDSPFSDYFTDPDARSLAPLDDRPATATQQLLLRMSKLQSRLIRDASPSAQTQSHDHYHSSSPSSADDAIAVVGKHLTSLEHELSTLTMQTRYAPELSDSGVFLLPEDDPVPSVSSTSTSSSAVAAAADDDPAVTITHLRAERDYFLLETQRVLAGLRSAQTQLRQRYDELRTLHRAQTAKTEEVEARNVALTEEMAGWKAKAEAETDARKLRSANGDARGEGVKGGHERSVDQGTQTVDTAPLPSDCKVPETSSDGIEGIEGIEGLEGLEDTNAPETEEVKTPWQELLDGLSEMVGMQSW